jgi:hypothetical protein
MCLARPHRGRWRLEAPVLVGAPETLLGRLRAAADGAPVAFGIDCPLGVPRGYAAAHAVERDFPAFLRGLAGRPGFFEVAGHGGGGGGPAAVLSGAGRGGDDAVGACGGAWDGVGGGAE